MIEATRLNYSPKPAESRQQALADIFDSHWWERWSDGKQEMGSMRRYLLEKALHADVALIKAWKADRKGNLLYRKSARNFNPLMAMAAQTVIVEAEEIVEVGELDPDAVMTPGIFVDFLTKGVSVDG